MTFYESTDSIITLTPTIILFSPTFILLSYFHYEKLSEKYMEIFGK